MESNVEINMAPLGYTSHGGQLVFLIKDLRALLTSIRMRLSITNGIIQNESGFLTSVSSNTINILSNFEGMHFLLSNEHNAKFVKSYYRNIAIFNLPLFYGHLARDDGIELVDLFLTSDVKSAIQAALDFHFNLIDENNSESSLNSIKDKFKTLGFEQQYENLNCLLKYLKFILDNTISDVIQGIEKGKFDTVYEAAVAIDEFDKFINDTSWVKFLNLRFDSFDDLKIPELYFQFMKYGGGKSVFDLYGEAQTIELINSNHDFKSDIDKLQRDVVAIQEDYQLNISAKLNGFEASQEWFNKNKETIEKAKEDILKLKNHEGTVRYGKEYQAQYDMAAKIFVGIKSKPGLIAWVINFATRKISDKYDKEVCSFNFWDTFKDSPVNGHLKVHHYGHLKVHHFKSGF